MLNEQGATVLGRLSHILLYLPNPPNLSNGDNAVSIIQANGNHWRKILSIYAKLVVKEGRWQDYRDGDLLREQAISFHDTLIAPNTGEYCVHWVAGKASWERLGISLTGFTALDAEERAWYKGNILLTPYPDYRQFPNRLIEEIRVWLAHPDRAVG